MLFLGVKILLADSRENEMESRAQSTRKKNAENTEIYSAELSERDEKSYKNIINTDLTPRQQEIITTPHRLFPKQRAVLATHFHPEHIPLSLIEKRIKAMFPNRETELIIPTQHNILMSWNEFSGVEVDCYASGFNRKVQLLLHFRNRGIKNAHVLKEMLGHTFTYRSKQLQELIATIIDPVLESRLQQAAAETGATESLIRFVRAATRKFFTLFEKHESETPPQVIKNKMLRDFFDELRSDHDRALINHAQILIKAAKNIMKSHFPLSHFYRAEEIIEETRLHGGGIVIPHPEQFWPILLADYDVDGYEVWNPQSQQYTEFLITVVNRHNKTLSAGARPILIFMGDDTHMGEKVKDPEVQDPEKAAREAGYQPAWNNLTIRKSLIMAQTTIQSVIKEYTGRLS